MLVHKAKFNSLHECKFDLSFCLLLCAISTVGFVAWIVIYGT